MQSFKDSGIYELLFKKNDPSNSIIDPLTCVVRLALLKYKPHGTKISVKENQISYNEPHLLQGPLRWTFGDCRGERQRKGRLGSSLGPASDADQRQGAVRGPGHRQYARGRYRSGHRLCRVECVSAGVFRWRQFGLWP